MSQNTRFLCYYFGLKYSSVLFFTLIPSLDDGADYDGFHDNDEGEEDDNDENWVYLYNANLSPGVCLEKRRQK